MYLPLDTSTAITFPTCPASVMRGVQQGWDQTWVGGWDSQRKHRHAHMHARTHAHTFNEKQYWQTQNKRYVGSLLLCCHMTMSQDSGARHLQGQRGTYDVPIPNGTLENGFGDLLICFPTVTLLAHPLLPLQPVPPSHLNLKHTNTPMHIHCAYFNRTFGGVPPSSHWREYFTCTVWWWIQCKLQHNEVILSIITAGSLMVGTPINLVWRLIRIDRINDLKLAITVRRPLKMAGKGLERKVELPGIKPGPLAYHASALPLS